MISYSLCEKGNYDFAPSYVIIILTFTVVYFVYSDFSMTSALFRWLLFIWLLHLLQKALILHRWLNRIFCTCSHWNKKLYDGISDNDNTFTVFTCSIFKIMVHVHLAQCILKDSFPSSFVWSGKKIVKNILLMARIKVCYFIVRY